MIIIVDPWVDVWQGSPQDIEEFNSINVLPMGELFMRRTTQVFVTMLTAGAMLLGFGNVANAKPAAASAVTVTVSSVPAADSPQVRQITQALQSGQAVNLRTVEGSSATLTLNNGVINVGNVVGPVQVPVAAKSICASAVAAALFALGAIALLALAATGVGVVIGGVLFTSAQIAGAAAVSGGLFAYYAWAETHVC